MRTFSRREGTQKKTCEETSSFRCHGLKNSIEVSENAIETLWNI
jgi:hypothetical protein